MAKRKKKTTVRAKSTKSVSKGNGSKDPSAKKDNPYGLTGPVVDDETGAKCFSKADLSMYELAQYKLANMTQGVRLKQIEIDRKKKEAEAELRQLQSQKEHLRISAQKHSAELVNIQNAITDKYGVDLSKISYDDETGLIHVPEELSEEPTTEAAGQPAA
jgi:hypothetical protein